MRFAIPAQARSSWRLVALAAAGAWLACASARRELPPTGDAGAPGRDTAGSGDKAVPPAEAPAVTDAATAGDAASLETAAPTTGQRRLSVTLDGPGTVLVDGAPLACPGRCQIDRPAGTRVALEVRAAEVVTPPTILFLGWTGACTGKRATCDVTLDADRDVTARFHRYVLWDQAGPQIYLAPVPGALMAVGYVENTTSIGARSFTSVGGTDVLALRFGLDGALAWATQMGSPDNDIGRRPFAVPSGFAVSASFGRGATVAGHALPQGYAFVTLDAAGAFVRVEPRDEFVHAVRAGVGSVSVSDTLQELIRRDEAGKEIWSKPTVAEEIWLDVALCADGTVLASRVLASPVPFAGVTRVPVAGAQRTNLIVALSPAGTELWAVTAAADRVATIPVCGDARTAYLRLAFAGTLRFDTAIIPSMLGDEDVGVVKLSQGSRLWMTTFGSVLPDAIGSLVFDAEGNLVLVPILRSSATIAGETLARSSPIVRIDAATGQPRAATDLGRNILELVRSEAGDYFFSGPNGFGRMALP